MSNPNIAEELDQTIDRMMMDTSYVASGADAEVLELAEIANELRCLPRAEFKARLMSELQQKANGAALPRTEDVLPTLFGAGYGNFPVRRVNFIASFVLQSAALALIVTSGLWMVQHREDVQHQVVALLNDPSPYDLPAAPDKVGGGGGGGDRDKTPASKGTAPRFAKEQLAPPAVVIRNNDPALAVDPTVIGPPSITLPQSAQMGDPMSKILSASNGTGFGGGIGDGSGGGVGGGRGPGVGPGYGGGIGGGPFRVGGGVSAPRTIYDPDPDYSDEARKARYQGSVLLWVVIGADGIPRDIKVARSLGMGLDEKAVEAVRKWKFEPGKKDGHPVAVQVIIDVNFRLY